MKQFDPSANGGTGAWTDVPVAIPSFILTGGGDASGKLIGAPVSSYGVIMYVKIGGVAGTAGSTRVFLYKHATPPPCMTDADCPSVGPCMAATCDASTGACQSNPVMDGMPCPNGTCMGGVCTPSSSSDAGSTGAGTGATSTGAQSGGGGDAAVSGSGAAGPGPSGAGAASASGGSAASPGSGESGGCGCRTGARGEGSLLGAALALLALIARRRGSRSGELA